MISQLRHAAMAAMFISVSLPGPARAESAYGAYLAGRQAVYSSDFAAAADYFGRALLRNPGNAEMMKSVIHAQMALGRMDRALPVAKRLRETGERDQMTEMVITGDLIKRDDYTALLARDLKNHGIGPLVDGLVSGWAELGAGSVARALEQFDKVAGQSGLRGFALYHKALALALVGDFEAAEAIFADEKTGRSLLTRRGILARAEILSQLGRNRDALDMMASVFGTGFDPAMKAIADRLEAGETLPFTRVTSVRDGMAEVFFSVGAALKGEAADDYTLVYARMADYLRPGHADAILLSAQLLDSMGQYDLAVATYKLLPADSPQHYAAELGRAEALRQEAKPDAAIEVLEQLAREYPTLPDVYASLGDLLRQQQEYAGAIDAYDKAVKYGDSGSQTQWFLFYARGISHERLGHWPKAEADFRAALDLSPDQPQVLNYLGYSLVEKQENLDEALGMIQRAAAARPESGYIIDSLGWVLYRLGRYGEAVGRMEDAVRLMPVDPVVNDHLGDVYWAVGRHREAEFQWKRALSFIKPDDGDGEADPVRIRRKLDAGLDAVLAEEGAPPLKVATDGE